MRVFVTGATGFVGKAVVAELLDRGDAVVALVRNPDAARKQLPPKVELVTASDAGFAAALATCDGVVNLAGEPVIGRWTDRKREAIRESRIDATNRLVDAMLQCSKKMVLVSASAVGYYGDSSETLDENAPAGTGFLAEVCVDWEKAAQRAAPTHRVAIVRIGVVLGKDGGALQQMLPAFKAFVGGPVGSGHQWVSFIQLADLVALIVHALDHETYSGPLNATAPNPVTGKQLADAIGRALGRPSWLQAPSFALRAVFGEAASVLLGGQKVLPKRALALGFQFQSPTVDDALRRSV